MKRHIWLAIAGLTFTSAPALAQEPLQERAAGHGDMMTHVICEMGMFPGMPHAEGMMMRPAMMRHDAKPAAPGQPAQPAPPAQPARPGQPAQPAQPHQGMQHAPPAEGMGAMMRSMDHTRTAHMLAEHGDEMGLALTDAQKTQLNQLAAAAKSECETHVQAGAAAHMAALTALQNGNVDEYEDKLEDAVEHAVQAHVPVIRSGLEAKALLTDEQRAKLPTKAHGAHTP